MANYIAGFNAKLDVNSTPYAVQRYMMRDNAPRQDASNTEGNAGNPSMGSSIGFGAVIGGLKQGEGTFTNATFDANANPFAAPRSIGARNYISLTLWLVARGSGSSWTANSFYIETCSTDGTVQTLQPITFSGYTDSGYSIPIA